jgi:hypothetical protein
MARLNLKRRIREVWQKLSILDASPEQIAAGFSIGIAASFLPLNPFPIIVGSVVEWLLKRNVIAVAAGEHSDALHAFKLNIGEAWAVPRDSRNASTHVTHASALNDQNASMTGLSRGWRECRLLAHSGHPRATD